jgi:hypothetical protein
VAIRNRNEPSEDQCRADHAALTAQRGQGVGRDHGQLEEHVEAEHVPGQEQPGQADGQEQHQRREQARRQPRDHPVHQRGQHHGHRDQGHDHPEGVGAQPDADIRRPAAGDDFHRPAGRDPDGQGGQQRDRGGQRGHRRPAGGAPPPVG